MPWMTITEYQETYFTVRSKPSRNTVKAWVDRKELVGRKFGGQWYVDPTADPDVYYADPGPYVAPIATDNELVWRVLREA